MAHDAYFRRLEDLLSEYVSRRGVGALGVWEWCAAAQVIAVGHGRGRHGGPALVVEVPDEEALRAVPQTLTLFEGGEAVPVVARLGMVPTVQDGRSGSPLSIYNADHAGPQDSGTVCALVRDAADSSRLGVISAAHVLAAAPTTQRWDRATIGASGPNGALEASLRRWWPTFGVGAVTVELDAALLEVAADTAEHIKSLLPMPVGCSGFVWNGMDVTVRGAVGGDKSLTGKVQEELNTWVRVARSDGSLNEYFLQGAIKYAAHTHGGDSGAPVFNDRNELIGMHCAGVSDGEMPYGLFWRITRVLDSQRGFGLELVTS